MLKALLEEGKRQLLNESVALHAYSRFEPGHEVLCAQLVGRQHRRRAKEILPATKWMKASVEAGGSLRFKWA